MLVPGDNVVAIIAEWHILTVSGLLGDHSHFRLPDVAEPSLCSAFTNEPNILVSIGNQRRKVTVCPRELSSLFASYQVNSVIKCSLH